MAFYLLHNYMDFIAIHEIKKVLHEADKYEKYDEKELDKEFKEINDLLL
ncbi:hypothetical protein GHI13_14780 [Enterococcus faecium]|nr:hypothetical protein [Enterococcus faecium]MCZ1711298.1 hypothetical protein [Enterococcus faecium]MCZ1714223.1 hypothetical protein [Enterococcus faecium]MCZ1850101.1 hypothetical protein [Enterococcus faecium]MCZ1855740.1 hypothetical protein [Enterococcus faecium]